MEDSARDKEALLTSAAAGLEEGDVDDNIDALMERSRVEVGVSDMIQFGFVQMMSTILGLFSAVYFSVTKTTDSAGEQSDSNNKKRGT